MVDREMPQRDVPPRERSSDDEHRWGALSLMVAIAAGVVLGGLTLGAAFWLLGLVASVVGALLHLVLLIGVAVAVIWCIRFCFRGGRCRGR